MVVNSISGELKNAWLEGLERICECGNDIIHVSMVYSNGFQPGFPGTLAFHQHCSGAPPQAIQMLRPIVYLNPPMQICEQGFLEQLEC